MISIIQKHDRENGAAYGVFCIVSGLCKRQLGLQMYDSESLVTDEIKSLVRVGVVMNLGSHK